MATTQKTSPSRSSTPSAAHAGADRGRSGRGARHRPVHRRQAPRRPRSRGCDPPGARRARRRPAAARPMEHRRGGWRLDPRGGDPAPDNAANTKGEAPALADRLARGELGRHRARVPGRPARTRTSDPPRSARHWAVLKVPSPTPWPAWKRRAMCGWLAPRPAATASSPAGSRPLWRALFQRPPRARAAGRPLFHAGDRLPHKWGSRPAGTDPAPGARVPEKFLLSTPTPVRSRVPRPRGTTTPRR